MNVYFLIFHGAQASSRSLLSGQPLQRMMTGFVKALLCDALSARAEVAQGELHKTRLVLVGETAWEHRGVVLAIAFRTKHGHIEEQVVF